MSWGEIILSVAVIALTLAIIGALIAFAIFVGAGMLAVRASDLADGEPEFDLAEPNRSSWEQ